MKNSLKKEILRLLDNPNLKTRKQALDSLESLFAKHIKQREINLIREINDYVSTRFDISSVVGHGSILNEIINFLNSKLKERNK